MTIKQPTKKLTILNKSTQPHCTACKHSNMSINSCAMYHSKFIDNDSLACKRFKESSTESINPSMMLTPINDISPIKHDPTAVSINPLPTEVIVRHINEAYNRNTDSIDITIGTPGKEGSVSVKVYFDSSDVNEAKQRINNAIELRSYMKNKILNTSISEGISSINKHGDLIK